MSYEQTLRTNLTRLVEAYSVATGSSYVTIGRLIANDPRFVDRIMTRSFQVSSYDRAASRLSTIWPSSAAWPGDIPRPPPDFRPPASKEQNNAGHEPDHEGNHNGEEAHHA